MSRSPSTPGWRSQRGDAVMGFGITMLALLVGVMVFTAGMIVAESATKDKCENYGKFELRAKWYECKPKETK